MTAAEDPLERLGKLKAPLDAGALTDEEFAQQKARLLEAL
ncbi:MAG: SHOCT domain-containing protein [Thermoleophilaceae bacterium]